MIINALEVKKIRDNLDMNQKQFAKLIGVSERTVQNYESGQVIPETKHEILQSLFSDNLTNKLNTTQEVRTSINAIMEYMIKNTEDMNRMKFDILNLRMSVETLERNKLNENKNKKTG